MNANIVYINFYDEDCGYSCNLYKSLVLGKGKMFYDISNYPLKQRLSLKNLSRGKSQPWLKYIYQNTERTYESQ